MTLHRIHFNISAGDDWPEMSLSIVMPYAEPVAARFTLALEYLRRALEDGEIKRVAIEPTRYNLHEPMAETLQNALISAAGAIASHANVAARQNITDPTGRYVSNDGGQSWEEKTSN